MKIALTGATGFVGGHLLDLALAEGHEVRALVRRPQAARDGVTWITGALNDAGALGTLVEGAEAVLHVAGVVNADRAGFARGNIEGTRAMVAAGAGKRFVHVSSLAAREPQLSVYGWSKAEAERIVMGSDLDWTIVRPTGVYGPRDSEMRELFRMASRGVMLMPPRGGRVSLIAVEDLARLLLALAVHGSPRRVLEADDGSPGYAHADLAQAIGRAVERRVRVAHMPAAALRLAARVDMRARGPRAKLTLDRARYLSHPDWTADPARRPPAELWRPRIGLDDGLAATAAWYRAQRLL